MITESIVPHQIAFTEIPAVSFYIAQHDFADRLSLSRVAVKRSLDGSLANDLRESATLERKGVDLIKLTSYDLSN